ncbi:hypothetical protein AB205_0113930 [Aquarana catesbeiana]|uniref:Uncharacterized protein n=1 Tax=Aquarana catesbeiana TaxID=8400 RepID=A0A2G9QDE0_AQUCT|nr:hypothetical protein AB205_0113930 [Aquarana catesbeiana]
MELQNLYLIYLSGLTSLDISKLMSIILHHNFYVQYYTKQR